MRRPHLGIWLVEKEEGGVSKESDLIYPKCWKALINFFFANAMAVCCFTLLLLLPKRDVCGFALRLLSRVSKEKRNSLKREVVSYISAQPFFWKLALRECDFRAQKSSRCYYYFYFTGQCFGFFVLWEMHTATSLLHYENKSILYLILNS